MTREMIGVGWAALVTVRLADPKFGNNPNLGFVFGFRLGILTVLS